MRSIRHSDAVSLSAFTCVLQGTAFEVSSWEDQAQFADSWGKLFDNSGLQSIDSVLSLTWNVDTTEGYTLPTSIPAD